MVTTQHGRRTTSLTTRTVALLCLAIVFAATSLQAAHICGPTLLPSTVDGTSINPNDSTATVICLSCITAHSTAPVAIIATPAPVSDTSLQVPAAEPNGKSAQDTFALYVRPPPVA
jgi:hypothetical protein